MPLSIEDTIFELLEHLMPESQPLQIAFYCSSANSLRNISGYMRDETNRLCRLRGVEWACSIGSWSERRQLEDAVTFHIQI